MARRRINPLGTSVMEIHVKGVTGAKSQHFTKQQREIQERLFQGLDNAAEEGVKVLKHYAPEGKTLKGQYHSTKGGGLRRAIQKLRASHNAIRPSVAIGVYEGAGSPALRDGHFPYLNVTRFGRRAFATHFVRRPGSADYKSQFGFTSRELTEGGVPTGQRIGRPAALAWPAEYADKYSGGSMYRRGVKAYTPTADWVAVAAPAVKAAGRRAMEPTNLGIHKAVKRGFSRALGLRMVE